LCNPLRQEPPHRDRPRRSASSFVPAGLLTRHVALLVSLLPLSAAAAQRCVVLVLPPGGWAEMSPATREALESLAREGAGGSLSCAVPRPMTEAAGWVTLGAGNRAIWPAGEVDGQGTVDPGTRNEGLARVLHEANERLAYPIEIGSVGEALHRAGLKTAVIGASEPWHVAAAMDEKGRVDLCVPGAGPEDIREALDEADYIVINGSAAGGDGELASRVDLTASLLGPDDLLVAAALAPRDAPFIGLAPIVVRGPGFSSPALTSATTRRGGVVANIDLAPTILAFFRLPLPQSYRNGSPIAVHPRADFEVPHAIWLDAKGRQADAFRPVGVPTMFVLHVVLVLALLLGRWPRSLRLRVGVMQLLLWLPIATYLVAVLPPDWPPVLSLGLVLGASGLAAGAGARRATLGASMVALSGPAVGATTALLMLDLLGGKRLQPIAPIGYSLGLGGRFYGIGNEAAGLLIAAAVVAAGLCLAAREASDRGSVSTGTGGAILIAALVVVWLAAPPLGANAGCTLAGVIAFGTLFVARSSGRRTWLRGLAVAVIAIAILLGVACLDASRGPESMTHLGRAWTRLSSEGWRYAVEFGIRKLTSSWEALVQTPASLIAGAWVLFWTCALLRPMAFVGRAYGNAPALRPPLVAIAVGGLAAALLNDSTVAIPTMMLSIALPVLGLGMPIEQSATPRDGALRR